MTTFYICPTCFSYWSRQPIPSDPSERHNGGALQCLDCRDEAARYALHRYSAREDAEREARNEAQALG